jgi:hypothetical protein
VLCPCVTVRLVGDTEIVKVPVCAGFTVSEIGCVCVVCPALDARIVIEASPVGVAVLVATVSVELIEPLAGGVTVWLGVVPWSTWLPGRFRISSSTPLLNPFWLNTVTV